MPDRISPPRRPWRRPTILLLMIVVAVVAVALGALKSRRDDEQRARLARVKANLERAEARVKWSEEMHRKGYVSKATAVSDRLTMDKAKAELKEIDAAR